MRQIEGPGRRLLTTRRIGGKVVWKDDGTAIVGATVKAYDMDVLAEDYMGSSDVRNDGGFVISYTDKDWDSCCFGLTRPDIKLRVRICMLTRSFALGSFFSSRVDGVPICLFA